MIRVQMVRQHRAIRVGEIVEFPDGVAELMIRYGRAIRLEPERLTEPSRQTPSRKRKQHASRSNC